MSVTEYKFIPQSELATPYWGLPVDANILDSKYTLEDYKKSQLDIRKLQETDPNGMSPATPGAKLDAGKIRPWLCIAGFSYALEEVARVTTKGAEKYTPNGWAEVPDGANRYMEAFGRHLVAYGKGKVFDNGPKGLGPDIYHKAQMIWNLLASFELELREKNGL